MLLDKLNLRQTSMTKLFIRSPTNVRRLVTAFVFSLGLAPYLTPAQAEVSADLRVEEAERELAEEIRRLYLKAHVRYRMKDYAGAERFFGDCYALYQASREHFSGSSDLAALSGECERHMQDLAILRRREAISGGWKARLTALRLNRFTVHDAELGATLEYFRQRVAKSMNQDPPNFVFADGTPKASQRVTMDLEDVNAIDVLTLLADTAGWEVRFEKRAIVFAQKATVQ